MKKSFILSSLLLITLTTALAQSGQFTCSSYKDVYRFGNSWGNWPNHWTSFSAEGRSNPKIRVTTISDGQYYKLQMIQNGKIEASFMVKYDPEMSQRKREDWDNQYVNCYADTNGDYIYTEEVSLKSLAENPTAWSTNEKSKIYMWIFSEDYAVVVR